MVDMQKSLSVLKFNNVLVDKIEFNRNDIVFDDLDKIGMQLQSKVLRDEENANKYRVIIDVKINDNKTKTVYLYTSISGFFDFECESDMKEDLKKVLLHKNAITILFPYVRSFITNITSQAGIRPIILPPINVEALIKNQLDNNKKSQ